MISGLSAPDIIAPQSEQNLVSVFTECGGISYFRDSDDEPHVLQNRSSLSIVVLYATDLHMGPMATTARALRTGPSVSRKKRSGT